jgi:hypothetical protein
MDFGITKPAITVRMIDSYEETKEAFSFTSTTLLWQLMDSYRIEHSARLLDG